MSFPKSYQDMKNVNIHELFATHGCRQTLHSFVDMYTQDWDKDDWFRATLTKLAYNVDPITRSGAQERLREHNASATVLRILDN